MKDRITKRVIFLFLLAGLIGFIAFIFYYDRAFPEASIDLALSREEAVSRSRRFLEEQGFVLSGYRSVAIFDEKRKTIDFVERQLGLDAANDLFRSTLAVWRWKVRWFKELNETEYAVELSPDGRLVGFSRVLPDSARGARLSEDQARRAAELFLSRELALKLSSYRYIERMTEDHPARLDQALVWRYEDFKEIPGTEYRISVVFQGDKIAGYSQWLQIPQEWRISQQRTEARRNVLSQFSYLPVMLLFLCVLVVFFWRSHAGGIRWRKSIVLAGVSGGVVLLAHLNELPLALLSYATTQSLATFWLDQLSTPLLSSVLAFLFFVPLFGATDVAGRLYLEGRPWSTGLLSRQYLLSGEAFRQVLLGYGMAFAAVGYVTLFYVVGEGALGVWSPVDVKFGDNFSTYFPSFSAVYTGFSAAFMEELIFRLFAVALLLRLTGRFWPAIVVPALIWGFAHTTYPQEPIWIRGIELSIAGIAYGYIFLRYGLITTLVSHFLYNVFIGVVPQLRSGQAGPIAGALFALALPLAVILATQVFRRLNLWQRFSVPSDRKHERAPDRALGEPVYDAAMLNGFRFDGRPWWCMVLGLAFLGASFLVPDPDVYDPPPPSRLTVRQAAELCDRFRVQAGFDARGYRSFTEFSDEADAIPEYAVDRVGVGPAREALKDAGQRRAQWITKWYKEKTIQKLQVAVDEEGRLIGMERTLADTDRGSRLDEEEARSIASEFLVATGRLKLEDWEYVEGDKTERPNRTDYRFTYRETRVRVTGLQRKISVTVSGSQVTAFEGPWYSPPQEWLRSRELQRQEPRNMVRGIVAGFIAAAIAVFLIVQLVILFKRRLARRMDVASSWRWALVMGLAPVVLWILNAIPAFYDGYFYRTEQSLPTYALMALVGILSRVVWLPVSIFLLFLVAHLVLRAWMPEGHGFQSFIDRIRPSRWKTPANRKGVIIGFAMAFLGFGIDYLTDSCKAVFAPDLLSLVPAATSIDLRRLSEILTFATSIPKTIVASAGILLVAALCTRFLRGRWKVMVFFAVVSIFAADTESLSWKSLLLDWSLGLIGFGILLFAVTELVGWNPMAYLIWMWVDFNGGSVANFTRFVLAPSPAFFWPSVQQVVMLLAPAVAVLLSPLISRSGGRVSSKEPTRRDDGPTRTPVT